MCPGGRHSFLSARRRPLVYTQLPHDHTPWRPPCLFLKLLILIVSQFWNILTIPRRQNPLLHHNASWRAHRKHLDLVSQQVVTHLCGGLRSQLSECRMRSSIPGDSAFGVRASLGVSRLMIYCSSTHGVSPDLIGRFLLLRQRVHVCICCHKAW